MLACNKHLIYTDFIENLKKNTVRTNLYSGSNIFKIILQIEYNVKLFQLKNLNEICTTPKCQHTVSH